MYGIQQWHTGFAIRLIVQHKSYQNIYIYSMYKISKQCYVILPPYCHRKKTCYSSKDIWKKNDNYHFSFSQCSNNLLSSLLFFPPSTNTNSSDHVWVLRCTHMLHFCTLLSRLDHFWAFSQIKLKGSQLFVITYKIWQCRKQFTYNFLILINRSPLCNLFDCY